VPSRFNWTLTQVQPQQCASVLILEDTLFYPSNINMPVLWIKPYVSGVMKTVFESVVYVNLIA
jgi:hypothetical protein